MAHAETRKARPPAAGKERGLGFTQSLQFKLGALFLLALLLLAAGAFLASRTLVQEKLLDERFRYEQESGLRLVADLRALIGDAQALAVSLANLATDPSLKLEQLRSAGPTLLKNRPSAALITSLGIWPEPGVLPGMSERNSLYWARDSEGDLRSRNDYNDARSAPYYRERWYTPARFLGVGRGLWTERRLEPLASRYVLTYVVPIRLGGKFAGTVTVSLDAGALDQHFAMLAAHAGGYALLLDAGERLIGSSGNASKIVGNQQTGMTLATLAKAQAEYAPLALAEFRRNEARRAAMIQSKRYDAEQVSALKDGTRELSRQEAEDILTNIWMAELPKPTEAGGNRTALESDPVIGRSAWASVFDLLNPAWTLVSITPANEGLAGASYLFRQSLVVTLGLVTLTLLLAFLALRALVIRPLRRMIDQLAGSGSVDDALNIVLDSSARNEVGMLAHWQNERILQLRDAMDTSYAIKSQLVSESLERRRAQEHLARTQERAGLSLQLVSDAVVSTNAQGEVEEMNRAAEQLVGMSAREARGKPLTEVVRLSTDDSGDYLNLALVSMEKGARKEYLRNVRLVPYGGEPCELFLTVSPLRANEQMVGAVLVFREYAQSVTRDSTALSMAANRHQYDLLTGLATRAGAEQRIDLLIEQAGLSGLEHGLIFLDIDHLKRINDSGGQAAGDDVLVRAAETLKRLLPSADDLYRIAADQFVVVVESTDEAALSELAETLRAQLAAARFYWESAQFNITASFGLVLLTREMPNASEAIRRADDACAAAKRAGRNTVQCYEPGMDRVGRTTNDDNWVRCIRRGLSDNQFHLRTQWIMPGGDYLAEGQAYEVLLALEDDEGFWASPAAFMPVADRHQLSAAIDRWVIEQTLHHLDMHPEVVETMAFCSINLSSASLVDPGFLDFIAGCMAKAPQFAEKLCFEVRESAISDHPQAAALCFDVLHRIGCRLSVDHYAGRNLSDLAQMRRLPIDFIKLNTQGFKSIDRDPVEHMLAESILRIARHLKRRVIVNNVDDASTMETWKKLGADYFQGYAFAKPTPVAFQAPS